jgi:uncharacterized protein YbbC (DUF1343 family)
MRAHRLVVVLCLACAGTGRVPSPGASQVRPGIEVVLSDSAHLIVGKRLGLLTNHTGIDHLGRRDADLLLAARGGGSRLTVLFSPEHGFRGTEDREGLPDGRDSATGLPIYSLYGGSRSAARAALDSIDVLLIDLQDIGARFYTYPATAASLMRDASRAGKRVIILDRPNPVGGTAVQGNVRAQVADPDSNLVGFLPVAMRHGMTLGELARMANDLLGLKLDLAVVPAWGWTRAQFYDETGIPWIKPSPNMPSLESAVLYPGLCLFEGTNLSVGRGTPIAFQVLGAPWLDAAKLLGRLRASEFPGVEVIDTTFTPLAPTDGMYPGVALPGIRMRVTDRERFDATQFAILVLAALRSTHAGKFEFRASHFDRLATGPDLRIAIEAGRSPQEIWSDWNQELARFRERRAKYLIYP